MSLRKPATNPASKSLRLDEIFGQFRLKGFNALGFPVKLLVENDGSLREQLILWDGTAQQRARSETNGSLIASLYGKAAGTLTAVKVEATGEPDIIAHGKDSSSAIQAVRVDTSRVLQNRPYVPVLVLADGQLPAAKTTLYTVGTTRSVRVRLFRVENTSAVTTETVIVYVNATGTDRIVGRAVLAPLQAADFLSDGEEIFLEAADLIKGETTNATTVDYTICGHEEILP